MVDKDGEAGTTDSLDLRWTSSLESGFVTEPAMEGVNVEGKGSNPLFPGAAITRFVDQDEGR